MDVRSMALIVVIAAPFLYQQYREFKRVTVPYYRGLLTEVQRLTPTEAGRHLFNQGKHRFLGVAVLETAHDRVQWAVLDVQEKHSVAQRVFDETVRPKL